VVKGGFTVIGHKKSLRLFANAKGRKLRVTTLVYKDLAIFTSSSTWV